MDLPLHKMTLQARGLYSFLGVHSFLIGLFPFYIPVYLYRLCKALHNRYYAKKVLM